MPPMMPPGGMPGMPGGMPPGMPGMPGMGGPPQGNPAMGALDQLAGMPNQAKEQEALQKASANIQIALSTIYTRSAKAASLLSKAYGDIQKAREELEQLGQQPLGPPPDLLGGMMPSPMGPQTPMM